MKPERIAVFGLDAYHFRRDQAVRIGDVEVRVRGVERGAIWVDRPLWWRAWRWVTRWAR